MDNLKNFKQKTTDHLLPPQSFSFFPISNPGYWLYSLTKGVLLHLFCTSFFYAFFKEEKEAYFYTFCRKAYPFYAFFIIFDRLITFIFYNINIIFICTLNSLFTQIFTYFTDLLHKFLEFKLHFLVLKFIVGYYLLVTTVLWNPTIFLLIIFALQ